MKVVVTGGAGFIGGNLCRFLGQSDFVDEVAVIDDLSTGSRAALEGTGATLTEASILDRDALAEVTAGADAIVHLAALGSVPRSVENPVASHEANATGTLYVLEAAREQGAHIALASSSSVYGSNPTLPKVETLDLRPMSPYAVSKLATEQYAMAYAKCYGLDVLPFRFFNVFGPGQLPGHVYAAVVPVFLERALSGNALPVHGDGEQSRDFTYVGTVVETIATALRRRVTSTPMNLAFGTRTTLNELIRVMEKELGISLEVAHTDPRAGDVRHSQADNTLLRNAFPEITPTALGEGIARTASWMKSYL